MLNGVLGSMLLLSAVSTLTLNRFEQTASAILQTGTQVANLCIVLLGSMALWGGLLQVAQDSGITKKISDLLQPVIAFLFTGVKKGSLLFDTLCMSITANLIGLGAAATPMGLQAMQLMKQQNPTDTADNNMVTLVVLNTASFQILPTTAAVMRQAAGSKSPMDILVPVWVASVLSLGAALIMCRLLGKRS